MLGKILKQKRDAEDRLRKTSPELIFFEAADGSQSFSDPTGYARKSDLDGKADVDHSHAFISLTDTPNSYMGQAGKAAFVNAAENGLEFKPAGAGGTGAFDYGLITSPVDIQFDYGGIA